MPASRPAAIEPSTGLTEEARTRTSTSLAAGVGSGRSSRAAGGVSGSLSVMARMSVSWDSYVSASADSISCSTIDGDRLYADARSRTDMTPGRTHPTTTAPTSILDEHRSRPGLLLALLG